MNEMAFEALSQKLLSSPVFIYGAGLVANGVYASLKEYYHVPVESFMVASLDGNPSQIDGVPVRIFSELSINKKSLILAAIPVEHHAAIRNLFDSCSFKEVIFITPSLEYKMLANFFRAKENFVFFEDFPPSDVTLPDLCVYMAKSIVDKPIKERQLIPNWITPLQVGASLTDKKIAELSDNIGDNISERNKNYSELTATYWAWKNGLHDYTGICHYRRWFKLNFTALSSLSKIDALLPLPSVYYPSIREHCRRYIAETDWINVREVMQEAGLEKQFCDLLGQQYMYNYNLLIARQDIFADYCAWMFPLLDKIKERSEPPESCRGDRYMGYIGELMTTFYFTTNRERMKLAHGEKTWLI